MSSAVIHYALQRAGVIARILWGTPHASDAKLPTPAIVVLVGTIDIPPGMRTAHRDSPVVGFGMPERLFNFFLRVCCSNHPWPPRYAGTFWLSSDNQTQSFGSTGNKTISRPRLAGLSETIKLGSTE
jgi:hypothetical protein